MEVEIKDNVLYEGVFSFKTPSGYYATPLGFRKKGGLVHVNVYKTSRTYVFLSMNNRVVLNIVYDPYVYLYTALKDETNGLNKVAFYEGPDGLPRVKDSIAHLVLSIVDKVDVGESVNFIYGIEKIERGNVTIEPYSRCVGLSIEALVYLTKIKHISGTTEGFKVTVNYLNQVVATLSRVCRDPYHGELVNQISVLSRRWREES